jgi:DhnA family fructose-bisphosphate aldolase class Ia
MSNLGKITRLNRIFNHPSKRILSVAVDHMINYPINFPDGLRDMDYCLEKIVKGRPSAITMNKGIAKHFMSRHAGAVPFIIQQMGSKSDGSYNFDHAQVEEVAAMGADAIAVAICIRGQNEAMQMQHLAKVVTEAERYGLPVIPHIYPLGAEGEGGGISNMAEDVFYAVRVGVEMGADVIKVPYTGDVASFRDIVSVTPVPVVSAGGPRCETLPEAEQMMREVAQSGAAGATVGRNVWGFEDIPLAIETLKQAIFA